MVRNATCIPTRLRWLFLQINPFNAWTPLCTPDITTALSYPCPVQSYISSSSDVILSTIILLCICSLRFYEVDERLHYLYFTFFTLNIPEHLSNLIFMGQICIVKTFSEIFGLFYLPNNFSSNLIRQNLDESVLALRWHETWILLPILIFATCSHNIASYFARIIKSSRKLFPFAALSSNDSRCPRGVFPKTESPQVICFTYPSTSLALLIVAS